MDRIDKLLSRIPEKHQRQVLAVLDCLADSHCRETLRAEKLGGSRALYRIRTGRYRIIFHIDEHDRAIVDDLRPRHERTYRALP